MFSISLINFTIKQTKRALITLYNGIINKEFNNNKKKEKNDNYKIIMPDQTLTRLAFRVKEDASPQVTYEVSIRRADCDGIIVKVVPPAKLVVNRSRKPIELVLLINILEYK